MRIVIGIDGSESSLVAQRLLASAAWPRPREVIMVATYERPLDWSGAMPVAFAVEDEERLRTDLAAMLDSLAIPIRQAGAVVRVVVRTGRPADVLADVARERMADLLIVGTRGRGPARSLLLGSVSAFLVDHAPCPVLVARVDTVQTMLFATDGSETAAQAARILFNWGAFHDAPVEVLSVASQPSRIAEGMITPWALSGDLRATPDGQVRQPDHAALAEQMASRFRAQGWQARGMVRIGDAAEEISAAAVDLGADLIVTGSRGLGDLRRMLSGSVAHDVLLHAHASVLVMRGVVPARTPVREPIAQALGVA